MTKKNELIKNYNILVLNAYSYWTNYEIFIVYLVEY